MDRYNSKKCRALEDAIAAFGIPSFVEVRGGCLQVTLLNPDPDTISTNPNGSTVVSNQIPVWVTLD